MNRIKRPGGKLGIMLCSALLACRTYGQPLVSIGVSVPLPAVEIRTESDFYEPLAPQGEWVVVGSYGRCFRPRGVEAGWRPYCNGNWQRTDAGWYWVSDEPWAWATYHYGRWDFTDQYGWYWVPQIQWAPAWVSWHEGGGYVGWAPLYPSGVRVISPQAYVFVEERHFMEPVRRTTVVVNTTTIINKTVINTGPATAVIEKASGRKVQAVPVQELRHKQEATVVTKQRTPAPAIENKVPVRSKVEPVEKNTVAPRNLPSTREPAAVTHEPAAPAPKIHETQTEKSKPLAAVPESKPVPAAVESKAVPAAPASKPEARPEANHAPVIKEPAQPKAVTRGEQQQQARPSEKKEQRPPAEEKSSASERGGSSPAENSHENKPK